MDRRRADLRPPHRSPLLPDHARRTDRLRRRGPGPRPGVGPGYDFDEVSLRWVRDGFRHLPSWRAVPIEEGWGSAVALSATAHPWFGTLRPGTVHCAIGYTGHGLAQCHLGGRALSALALGAEDEVTRLPMVDGNPKRFPPEPFTSIGTRLVQPAILRKDRLEDVGKRPGWLTRLLASLPRRLGYSRRLARPVAEAGVAPDDGGLQALLGADRLNSARSGTSAASITASMSTLARSASRNPASSRSG